MHGIDGWRTHKFLYVPGSAGTRARLETLEQFGQHPEQGWKKTEGRPDPESFIEAARSNAVTVRLP
jgi:hypothetical protein